MEQALSTLLQELEREHLVLLRRGVIASGTVSGIAQDSRRVRTGGLFVAIQGSREDGHRYLEDAVRRGARAVVVEHLPDDAWLERNRHITLVQVSDSRRALSLLAAAWYRFPARKLRLIGITGTNGKTTTAFLVRHLLAAQGEKVGLIGTVAYQLDGEEAPASHTTPDPVQLHQMLRRMVDRGCTSCVMEVSSHALEQERVWGLDFDVAVFTNLTQDHLDYHGTLEAYFQAKKKLFDGLSSHAVAWYNTDDPSGKQMVANTVASVRAYGLEHPSDIPAHVLSNTLEGLELEIENRKGRFPLVGRFNAYNLLAAYGVGCSLGMEPAEVFHLLQKAPAVPGRFERVQVHGQPRVIVDYAHTPDALENVLRTLRETGIPAEHLWCVFGCGGDRDQGKRHRMGAIAELLAGHVVVTSDNPRTEPPEEIIRMILKGMKHPEQALVFPDRRKAIREAIERADAEDVVLIAGKGHETYQVVGTEHIPFDDREEARRALNARVMSENDNLLR